MTSLWRIDSGALVPISPSVLNAERNLQDWIEHDPSMLNQDLLIIGREVATEHSGRIDLLGLSSDGAITIIEFKRDKTPRDVVAQILDYASWISELRTPRIYQIAEEYFKKANINKLLREVFLEKFKQSVPDPLNTGHSMVIVASGLDLSSKRIVEYLSQVHGVAINTAFFNVFSEGGRQYLSADWLMDQEVVVERSETRIRAPWSGIWFANVGDGSSRSWEDMRKYGFLAAGGGRWYSGQLERLSKGDRVYAYQAQVGYVGYGIVEGVAVRASEFKIDGVPLFELPLVQPNLKHDSDNPEKAEYLVPIKWLRNFSLSEAKRKEGLFANQNIVCKLRHQTTLDFLNPLFELTSAI